ncbi:GGDEF domain-containing protein [Caenispirillum bisanense]|uniref:diguanylate cyclase n=1 Tax=Caenispirillum bisanense TaxID=414052 RepID=A0A286G272_9PROT|nr:GGDEF domain-containing protein [Caenispirillum bisanense]SOD89615.1 diguanylate cyclase (GGDEF) domain-containing protein [Caenispirillum bisanense]
MTNLPFDLPTLIGAMCMVSFSAGAALLLASHLHLPVKGLRYWGAGYLVTGLGLALTLLRGVIDPAVAIVGGNTLVAAGYLLVWLGARRLAERPVRLWMAPPPLIVAAVGMLAFLGDGGTAMRVAVMSLLTVVLTLLSAWEFARLARRRSLVGTLLAGLFAAHALFYAARAGIALGAAWEPAVYPLGFLGVPTFIEGFVWMIVTGFGLIVLTSEVLQAELTRQATRDPLTDLFNRRAFTEAAEREMVRARRHGRMPAFLLLDLDHFKRLNDTHGHDAGDRLLRAFALTAATDLRRCDVLARVGGEEFVLMLPETDDAGAVRAAERIRLGTELLAVATAAGDVAATVSVGVAVADAARDDALDEVLRRADRALYAAKAAGRNRIVVAPGPTP